MRQLYFFLLILNFSFIGYSQYSNIQVELVNQFVGTPIDICNSCEVNTSNDDGLNQIFANYNILNYQYIYPQAYLGENGEALYYLIGCVNCDVNQLVSDLNAYDSVIRYAAEETVEDHSVNILNLELVDATVGAYSETNPEDLIVTNDTGLTQIFENFNVREYVLYPTEEAQYSLVCDCDAQLLKAELEGYSSVISTVSDVFYGMLLSVEEKIKFKAEIYPNPFSGKVSIQINQPIESIQLYDILCKNMYQSNSIKDFENFSKSLKSGIYLLKLMDKEGNAVVKKIMKS